MAETIPRLLIGHGMEDDGDCKHDSSLHVMSNQKCPALFLGVEETYLFGTSRKWTLPLGSTRSLWKRELSTLTIRKQGHLETTQPRSKQDDASQ